MYINKIHIQNYRNYNDFSMNFYKGLNVIIGSNNSGKTGLLYAINLLNYPFTKYKEGLKGMLIMLKHIQYTDL